MSLKPALDLSKIGKFNRKSPVISPCFDLFLEGRCRNDDRVIDNRCRGDGDAK